MLRSLDALGGLWWKGCADGRADIIVVHARAGAAAVARVHEPRGAARGVGGAVQAVCGGCDAA